MRNTLLGFDAASKTVFVDRTRSGDASFDGRFASLSRYSVRRRLFRIPYLGEFLLPQRHFIACFDRLMIFNCMNTLDALGGTGVSCPPFPAYAGTLVRFARARFEEAEHGRSRPEKAEEEDPYS